MVNKGKQPIKKKTPPKSALKHERTLDDACLSSPGSSAAVQSCSEWSLQRCSDPAYQSLATQSSDTPQCAGWSSAARDPSSSSNALPTARQTTGQTHSASESHSSIRSTSAAVPLCSSQLTHCSKDEPSENDTHDNDVQTAAPSGQPTAAPCVPDSARLTVATLPQSTGQLRYRRHGVMSLLRSMQKFLTAKLRRRPMHEQITPRVESGPAPSTAPTHSSQPSASSSTMQEPANELAHRGVFVVPVRNMGSGERPTGGHGLERSRQLKHVRAHTTVDYHHYLVPDLTAVTSCGFYWGVMDRYEAESLLDDKPEGTFLLRDSSQDDFIFSVSFRRYGRSLHARIEQWNHMFSFDAHESAAFKSQSVTGLIEHYKDPHTCMFFEPMLTRPLNRPRAFSLQHLARAVVCDHISYDMIDSLTIPRNLQDYLRYYHYKQKIRVRTHSTSRDIHGAST